VIYWNDFILDDVMGPLLNIEEDNQSYPSCRAVRKTGRPSTYEGAEDEQQIQETRQEQRPARMVGLSVLESTRLEDMEVDRSDRALKSRPREEA
jgi:hypothetical protein